MNPVSENEGLGSGEVGGKVVTMAQIARHLGVSKATVSRALSGGTRVPKERRERIVATAAAMGWEPDARLGFLSALRWRGRRSGHYVIAYLCDRFTILHPAKRRALQTHAFELGYKLEYWRLDEEDGSDLAGRLKARGVQGVLVDLHQNEAVPLLPWEKHSAIVMGEEHADLPLHRVATDWPAVLELARVRAVKEHRRSVLLSMRHFAGQGLTREMARAAHAVGAEFRNSGLHCELKFFDESAEEPGGELAGLLQNGKFDAVLTCTAAATEVALAAVDMQNGPEIVYGLMQTPRADRPALACLDIQLEWRARLALDLLHLHLLRDQRGTSEQPVRHLLPGRWLT